MQNLNNKLVEQALEQDATPAAVVAGLDEVARLAKRSSGGDDPKAFEEYHRVLYHLHQDRNPRNYTTRSWLASHAHKIENQALPPVEAFGPLSPEALMERLLEEMARDTTSQPATAKRLFEGKPKMEEVKIYFRHHWYRSQWFYRDITEFVLRFSNVTDLSGLYENLFDETGGGNCDKPHPRLLRNLLEYLKVPCEDGPDSAEANAYLNFRSRCLRNPDVAWGCAYLFALEQGTPAFHTKVLAMLRRMDVPEEFCEFHTIHTGVDVKHANDVATLLRKYVATAEAQQIAVAVIREFLQLRRRYFDRIWSEIDAAARTSD
jgi:pyrroloquinoline quinone (PQQ) biosynthesis protein C